MVVKIINGMRIHEPPYTQAEEDEFYRRVGRGTVQSRRPQSSSSRRRQNRAALESGLQAVAGELAGAVTPPRACRQRQIERAAWQADALAARHAAASRGSNDTIKLALAALRGAIRGQADRMPFRAIF